MVLIVSDLQRTQSGGRKTGDSYPFDKRAVKHVRQYIIEGQGFDLGIRMRRGKAFEKERFVLSAEQDSRVIC